MNVSTKLSRKKQAEEFQLIKSLANSINDRHHKNQKFEGKKDNALQMFGCYVTETLTTLEPKMKHLAQHHINNLLFQAQMGSLGQEPRTAVMKGNYQRNQVHNQHFNWSTPSSNVAPSTCESTNLSQSHMNSCPPNQPLPDFVIRRSQVHFANTAQRRWVEDGEEKTSEELH